MSGYPPSGAAAGYPPPQPGYPPPQPGTGFPPPQQGAGYPPQGAGYPPSQPGAGYPPPQPPQPGAYPAPNIGVTTQSLEAWTPTAGMKYQGPDIGVAGGQPGHEPTAPAMPPPPVYTGYEGVNYDTDYLPPPPSYDSLPPPETPDMAMAEFRGASEISEDVVRESLLVLVGDNCCWGDAPAKDMRLNSIEPVPALHYTLETFNETRNTKAKTVPYVGGAIDGPHNGPPPPPWSIPVQPISHFAPSEQKIEVPHTASVVACNKCFARGFVRCWHCHGRGEERCHSCNGSGTTTTTEFQDGESRQVQRNCFSCNGRGCKNCIHCHGRGMVKCGKCEGYRMLKSFIQMKVKFEVMKDDYVYERTHLPEELIKNVSGQKVFEQSVPRVGPIVGYKIREINEKSADLVRKHSTAWPQKRMLYQRQALRAVPVTEIRASFKANEHVFWVFGDERMCHFPDYPSRCCGNCAIL